MDIAARLLNAFLMMALPIFLGVALVRKYHTRWRLFLVGSLTFIASQILHIPFNQFVLMPLLESAGISGAEMGGGLIVFALAIGLSAGVFEEIARYISYRTIAKEARTWEQGLMFGAGHGGIEAILLGVVALVAFIQIMALAGVDIASVVPSDQVDLARAQIDAYWALPWYGALLGAVERIFALCLHLFLSLVVLQALLKNQVYLLFLAILWHALVNAIAVVGLVLWGAYLAEVLVGILGLMSLAGVVILRGRMPRLQAPDIPKQSGDKNGLKSSRDGTMPSMDRVDDSRFYDDV